MGDEPKTYAEEWVHADEGGESSLTAEEKSLAGQLQALGKADYPDASFVAQVASGLAEMADEGGRAEEARSRRPMTFWGGMQRAWQWGIGLAGMALLLGVLFFSMSLLPRNSGAPGPAQPSLAGPTLTPGTGLPTATLLPLTYTVQAGDTWASIAYIFGVSVQELMALNGLGDVSELYVGQTLVIGPAGHPLQATEVRNEPTVAPTLGPIPKALVPDACPVPVGDALDPELFSPHYKPLSGVAGGGQVQSGPFTIDLWMACAPVDNGEYQSPYTPIPGLGVAKAIRYNGPGIDGIAEEFAGVEPFVVSSSSWGSIEAGNTSSAWDTITFPGVIPDLSRQDTHLRFVYKIRAPDGAIYGAALSFVLQRETGGYRPVDIQVEALSEAERQTVELDGDAPLPFPTLEPEDLHPELKEYQDLLDTWHQPMLAQPGWVHVAYDVYDPANGLYAPMTDWVRENWYQIDARGMVVAHVFRDRTKDERILQQSYTAGDRTINQTFGGEGVFHPFRLDLNAHLIDKLYRTLEAGKPIPRSDIVLDGKAAVAFTYSDVFEEPANFGDWEVVKVVSRDVVDAETGAPLISDTVVTTSGGEEILAYRTAPKTIERVGEPPAEILDLLAQAPNQDAPSSYQPREPIGTPAPEGFDPSRSLLKLVSIQGDEFDQPSFWYGDIYTGGSSAGGSSTGGSSTGGSSTGDYYLGRVDFGARPGGNCDRSADGSKLAYSYEILEGSRMASATLRWLDLREVGQVHEIAPELSLLGRVAWSPVSDQIAFSACTGIVEGRYQDCGMYLYDLPSDQVRLLTDAGSTVWDILWKPDGTQMAFVSTEDDRHNYFILEVASGKILSQGVFDADAWQFPDDAPVNEWGTSFPRGYEGTRCFVNP